MELSQEQLEAFALICPRCNSTDVIPYAGRALCKRCGKTWRKNGEPDED